MSIHKSRSRRESLCTLLQTIDPKIGVEVGVWKGALSEAILRQFPGLKLYMVDLWEEPVIGEDYYDTDEIARGEAGAFHAAYRKALEVARDYPKRSYIMRGDSISVSHVLRDSTIDFVFIDGNHTENAVYNDIAAWTPKVKTGGLVAGHDYELFNGVKKAVRRYFSDVNITSGDIWYVRV